MDTNNTSDWQYSTYRFPQTTSGGTWTTTGYLESLGPPVAEPKVMWATDAFLDEEGVWIESDVAVPATRLRLPLYVMRKVATLIQMYELSKMVPTDQDEPNAPDQALPVPP